MLPDGELHRWLAARITLNIDDDLPREASALTGVKEETTLVRMGLETLVARGAGRRLAPLGGTEEGLETAPRRRSR